jgi:DNA-directed RNA polymerase omega subunit
MIYPKIEDCVEAASCKYTLAILVAKRAKELTMKMPAEFTDSNTKEITYALKEVYNKRLVPVAG